MVFFFLFRVEWSGHHAVRSTCTQCFIVSGAGNLGNNLQFFTSNNARWKAHIEHFHTWSVLIVCSDSEGFASFHHLSHFLFVVPCTGAVRGCLQADAGNIDGSAYNHSRKHCQGLIGVHFCHQLPCFFHARQENPPPWRGGPTILLESVSRRRLIDLGTLGMSDMCPTFLHNVLFLSLNSFARRSRSQSCDSRSCLQN